MDGHVCLVCQAELRPDARFCASCGRAVEPVAETSDSSPVCASCAALLKEGARFCLACGKAVEPEDPGTRGRPTCHACGAALRPGALFCMTCGKAAEPAPRKRPPPSRAHAQKRRSRLVAASASLAAVGALLAGGWFLFLRDNSDSGPAGGESISQESTVVLLGAEGQTDPSGLPIRPHLRLEHPSGAWADVPDAPVVYGDMVDLRRVSLPDSRPGWEWDNVGWQFVSGGGLVISNDVTLTLPATGASGESVLALSHTGDWVELRSSATTLASGAPAREVAVGDVPSPWILVVARQSALAPESVEAPRSQVLEQLYWTDRAEWERQTVDSLAQVLFARTPDRTVLAHPATHAQQRQPWDLARDLDATFQVLGGARLGGTLDAASVGTPLPILGITPSAMYVEGLDRLDAVRKEWALEHARWERDYPDDLDYSEDQTLGQAIESALAYYAPWGIDLTRYLLHTGTIGTFDMRVVGPYGELLYADARLSSCQENKAIGLNIQELSGSGVAVNCYLRLYSRKAMQDTWVDWLKDWKLQTVIRWAPALLVTAGVVSGSGGTALLFAAADQLISFIQDQYAQDAPSAYLNLEVASASGTTGAFVVDTAEGLLQVEGTSASLTASGLGAAQTIYSVALLYGVSQTNWYMLQEVRSLTSGTRSYCPKSDCAKSFWTGDFAPIDGYDQIPPIQVVAVLQDRPPDYPADGYPAQRTQLRVWTLPLDKYGADLHRLYTGGASCEKTTIGISETVLCPSGGKWAGGLAELPFAAYKQDQWPTVVEYSAPAGQSMRLSLKKEVLDAVAAEYDLGASPSASDYGLVLRAEAPDGSRAVFQIDSFLDPHPGEDPDRVYFQLVIPGRWKGEPASLADLDTEYDGMQSEMSGSVLQTKLALDLRAHDDEEPRATGEVDFTAPGIKDVEVYPSIAGEEHIHFTAASLDTGPIVYSGETSQGLPISIVVDPGTHTWRLTKWEWAVPAAICGEPEPTDGEIPSIGPVPLLIPPLFGGGGTRGESKGDWGTVSNIDISSLDPADEDYATIVAFQWLTSGTITDSELRFAPPSPSVASLIAANGDLSTPDDVLQFWYGTTVFGTLDARGASISGNLKVPFSDFFDCPPELVTYTAERTK